MSSFKHFRWFQCYIIRYFVFLLLAYNIYIILKLLNSKTDTKQTFANEEPMNKSYFHFLITNGRWDSKRMIKTFDNVLLAEHKQDGMICLATQSSFDRLFNIVELAGNWNGPISMAVYAAGDELFYLQDYVKFLRRCYKTILHTVTFHLALPANKLPEYSLSGHSTDTFSCHQNPKEVLLALIENLPENLKRWRTRMPYPQNHLRNLARFNCQTHYSFVTDIDIIPSFNSARVLNEFLYARPKCLKCVYILPTYEVHQSAKSPNDFTQLMKLKNIGLARYFHKEVFELNQLPTNFDRFEKMSLINHNVRVSHTVSKYQLYYEPFYVSLNNVPSYEERFIGYGYTRNSQVYEMFAAKYQFDVLTNIFTYQHSFASLKKRSYYRQFQYAENLALFSKFKKEISTRYS
ncbi:beta-1,4-glucuronyltransferase 1-like [Adelges cooleyi]|uniref:beta-1,4-glucuronyltransferase 1-like n=1 Tax=Adelges cooleyi TaxID=133065 RepID=UPI00217FBF23|nr:beta-1,4-glucuronyltransferase 1-like [Adelges cooleyi]